jgi:hypothetical protein
VEQSVVACGSDHVAYMTYLAAVSAPEMDAYREGEQASVGSMVVGVSHVIASWVVQPLGKILAEAIDDGEPVSVDAWHPLRAPVWVAPSEVAMRANALSQEWALVSSSGGAGDPSDWYHQEIQKVVDLYQHAAAAGSGVVSCLEAPHDRQRARSTTLVPFAVTPRV